VGIDRICCLRCSQNESKHLRNRTGEIHHLRAAQKKRDGNQSTRSAAPYLSNDASRSHERCACIYKSLGEAYHHPVPSLEGDECARVEDDPADQAALLRRPRLVRRRNRVSARRTSSRLGWTSRRNFCHCLSSSALSSRSSTTPVTQADTGASPAAFLMRAATSAGTLIVMRRIDITIA
jgi:hypothetical protein